MSKNYDKIYAMLENTFRRGNIKKANELVDEIIKNKPYFKKPDIYWYKLRCLYNLTLKDLKKNKKYKDPWGHLWKSKAYRNIVKENIENYLFSYYINVSKERVGDHSEEGIVLDEGNWYPEQDQWKLIKLLNHIIEHDIETRRYKEDGDVCHVFIAELLNIYRYYGEDEKFLNHINVKYLTYKGLNLYEGYIWEVVKRASKDEPEEELQADDNKIWDRKKAEDYAIEQAAEAKVCFEEALALEADNPIANYALGRYYYEAEHNIDRALELLYKAEQSFISMWEPYYFLGKICIEKQNHEKARDYYILAIGLYKDSEEDGINALLEECVEDLNAIGGCRKELDDAAKDKHIIEEKNNFLPSKKQLNTNAHFINAQIIREFGPIFESFKKVLFSKHWDALSENSQEFLEWAEKAFYFSSKSPKDIKPVFAFCWGFYYQIITDEIIGKVFLPFKKDEWVKIRPEDREQSMSELYIQSKKEKDRRVADSMVRLMQFLGESDKIRKKIEKPTLGQVLGILALNLDANLAVKKIKDYASYKSSLLIDKDFRSMLNAINERRNVVIHSDIGQEKEAFLSHFSYFREHVIGVGDQKGLLPRFLESLN